MPCVTTITNKRPAGKARGWRAAESRRSVYVQYRWADPPDRPICCACRSAPRLRLAVYRLDDRPAT